MTLHLNDAGTWRQIQDVYVNDAGTWRQIKEVWVNDAGTWRMVHGDTVSLSNLTASSTGPASGSTVNAQYQLTNGGRILATQGTDSLSDLAPWLTPTTNVANYEVFATLTSGVLDSGPTGSWVNLGTTRAWAKSRSTIGGAGTSTATISLQIRRASDLVVVATANITISAVLT